MRLVGVTLLLVAAGVANSATDRGGRVKYIGGTVGQLAECPKGRIYAANDNYLVFECRKLIYYTVQWDRINLLEYGQKVGRRYLLAVIVSPLLLLSKARKHYLTVGFADENGHQQVTVFRVDKNDIRSLLASLEARTNLNVEYQDDEARQAGKGN